jgi:hypothetical protein
VHAVVAIGPTAIPGTAPALEDAQTSALWLVRRPLPGSPLSRDKSPLGSRQAPPIQIIRDLRRPAHIAADDDVPHSPARSAGTAGFHTDAQNPRNSTPVLVKFIAAYRDDYKVEPICAVLTESGYPIAPSTARRRI